jgi:hypothetical protein
MPESHEASRRRTLVLRPGCNNLSLFPPASIGLGMDEGPFNSAITGPTMCFFSCDCWGKVAQFTDVIPIPAVECPLSVRPPNLLLN